MRFFRIVLSLMAFVATSSTACYADQTITLNVPFSFNNIPSAIGQVTGYCYIFAPSMTVAALQSGASAVPLGDAYFGAKFTGTSFSQTFAVPITLLDSQLVGIAQPLTYQCRADLRPPGSAQGDPLGAATVGALIVQPFSATSSYGTIPLATNLKATMQPIAR